VYAQTRPVTGCADLRSLTNNEVSISNRAAAAGCARRLRRIAVSRDRSCRRWPLKSACRRNGNGRFVMIGNGGFAGEPPERADGPVRALPAPAGMRWRPAIPAFQRHGAGRDFRGGTVRNYWDYAYRSLHVTAEASKMLLRAYYGSAPAKNYYEGCSTGGRQG